MMQKRMISAALAAALSLSCCAPALAAETTNTAAETTTTAADTRKAGVLYFDQLEDTVRANNSTVRSCIESLDSLDTIDPHVKWESLRKQYNALTEAIWYGNTMLASTQAQIEAQMDAYEDDEYAKTYEDSKRQIESGVDQVIKGTESLYFQILTLENNLKTMNRSMASLERAITVTEARCKIGQASGETLRAMQDQKTALNSQIASLQNSIKTCKGSLQTMIGQTPTGNIEVAVPEVVTESQIAQIDLEADIAEGKEASITIYQNRRSAEKIKDDLDDMPNSPKLNHDYESALYTKKASEESFYLNASTLYDTLKENERLYIVSLTDLESAKKTFAIQQKKYDLGMISKQSLLDAQDTLTTAEEAVDTALLNLTNTYASYNWVRRGFAS